MTVIQNRNKLLRSRNGYPIAVSDAEAKLEARAKHTREQEGKKAEESDYKRMLQMRKEREEMEAKLEKQHFEEEQKQFAVCTYVR